MVVVLPRAVDGLAHLEAQISASQIQKWFHSMLLRPGQVFLPTFRAESQFYLKSNLSELGMRLPFQPEGADFHGLAIENIFISDVIHKAMAEVNEEGTVAAAATAIGGKVSGSARVPAEPFAFRADHPFLFLISVPRTGTILFFGRFGE